MIHRLEFPYVNDDLKTLAENRRDFKDFFSYLTNIRCAIVEGGHRCEAACRMLQGYLIGDDMPLEYHPVNIEPDSTLFRPTGIIVYHCQDVGVKLDNHVFMELKGKSQKV